MGIEVMGELIAERRFTEEERLKFRGIIKEFVQLYHNQYNQTWCNTTWRGVHTFKCPTDLWVYQELIHEIRPDVIIETGTGCGGSALYMADVLRVCGLNDSIIISIDIDHSKVSDKLREDKNIVLVDGSSVDSKVFERVSFFLLRIILEREIK